MACEGLRDRPHRPQVFDGLTLAGVGPLAFQGLSRGDRLLNGGCDSPRRIGPERSISAGRHS
jgi:hypothetical protein